MNRKKWTEEEFRKACKECFSIRSTLLRLGLRPAGGNYATVKTQVNHLKIDISHWLGKGQRGRSKRNTPPTKRFLTDILQNGTTYSSWLLGKRLVKELNFPYECCVCGINEWRGRSLSLHLDHKNGTRTDNRLENLRFLCPNCHSQTDTYCGRNIGKT